VGAGNHILGHFGESNPVLTDHVATQHSKHLRSGTFDDRHPCQQSWSQGKRQDRPCRGGQILLLLGDDMVEIGDDCAEHPEAP